MSASHERSARCVLYCEPGSAGTQSLGCLRVGPGNFAKVQTSVAEVFLMSARREGTEVLQPYSFP